MFAYGKTVSHVGAQCEPGDAAAAQGAEGILNQARGQAAVLVGALAAPSPSDRPLAEAATQPSPFHHFGSRMLAHLKNVQHLLQHLLLLGGLGCWCRMPRGTCTVTRAWHATL